MIGEVGCSGPAVILCCQNGGLFPGSFRDNLFYVFVAALRGFPGGVAEGFWFESEVDRVEELLVSGIFVGGCGRWHFC